MTSASASRVTRSRRNLRLALLAFAGVLAVVTVLRAQETSPAPEQQGSPVPAAPAAKAPASAGERGAAADAEAVQAKPATPAAPSPARFEPTEKVRADFDVSFPVDI
jgi:hypothetical protein